MLLLCFITGLCENMSLLFLSLTLHELSHTLMASRLGYTIQSITIQPFGFVASLAGDIDEWDVLCIATAGPFCSLIAGSACFALKDWSVIGPALSAFGRANMMIGLVNLLPALPLDGGRILRACLFRITTEAYRIAAWIGIGVAAAFFAFGVLLLWENNATMLFMGAFLLPAAIKELRQAANGKSRSLLQRAKRIQHGEALRVKYIAVNENIPAGEAYMLTAGSQYTLLHVVDDSMRSHGVIDEGELLHIIAAHGAKEPLRSFVDRNSLT